MLTPWTATFIALPFLLSTSKIVSLLRGQSLLNELRDRFPEQYLRAGRPSYFVLALWGPEYFRPAGARNFFTHRKYDEVPDVAFATRAAAVRRWQQVESYSLFAYVGVAALYYFVALR